MNRGLETFKSLLASFQVDIQHLTPSRIQVSTSSKVGAGAGAGLAVSGGGAAPGTITVSAAQLGQVALQLQQQVGTMTHNDITHSRNVHKRNFTVPYQDLLLSEKIIADGRCQEYVLSKLPLGYDLCRKVSRFFLQHCDILRSPVDSSLHNTIPCRAARRSWCPRSCSSGWGSSLAAGRCRWWGRASPRCRWCSSSAPRARWSTRCVPSTPSCGPSNVSSSSR